MSNTLSQLTSTYGKNYLHKMKNEIKTAKMLYMHDSLQKWHYKYLKSYYKDCQKLIVARPTRIIPQ